MTVFAGVTGFACGYSKSSKQTTKNTQPTGSHTSGVGKPSNNINPGGSYTKLDSKGNLYSYTQFDNLG